MPHALSLAAAKILSDHRRNRKAERDYRQEQSLHYSDTETESRLCGGAKADNDRINECNVSEEQDEFGAGWQTDAQHRPPGFHLRPKLRRAETQVVKFFLEVNDHQDVGDQNCDERGHCRASDAEARESDSQNQKRCEHAIDHDAQDLEQDGWPNNSGRAQR